MEKPGVDYNGPTAIRLASTDSILYRYLTSPECRRYSPDPKLCTNEHYFLHCGPEHLDPSFEPLEVKAREIEAGIDFLLSRPSYDIEERKIFGKTSEQVEDFARTQENANPPVRFRPFLTSRLTSFRKQLQFLAPKFH